MLQNILEKHKFILITGLFILCLVVIAYAESSIKAEVDKTSLTTDDILTYKIIITSSEDKIPIPKIPVFDNFRIISQAQSSTVSFAKSEIKTIAVYVFILAALDTGKLKIEPSTIKIKDKTYFTEPLEIEVTQGKTKPSPKPEEKPSLPEEPQPESESKEVQITL